MTSDEKYIVRVLFQNKLLRADGQVFQDLFTIIMNYRVKGFVSIKPWGNIGDRKNDGYIPNQGIFYQVYAPENIENNYINTVNKIKTDFSGLLAQWNPVNGFYFFINDKYKGINADAQQTIIELIHEHKLREGGILRAKDLEDMFFELSDDQMKMIVGSFPLPLEMKSLNYSILNDVIDHIMMLPLQKSDSSSFILPDWNGKIRFNNLSDLAAQYLNIGCIQISNLEHYLENNSDFLADSLQKKLNSIYLNLKERGANGDNLFWQIVEEISPRKEQGYQAASIILMAKYFETCDIFEKPEEEVKESKI